MALYAFNLEIARAPWVASEPGLAAIRLRWWHDAVAEIYEGQAAQRHEVVAPLAEAIRAGDLPRRLFEEMIAARLADAEAGAHADRAALELYIDHTAGHLMELAARHLGAEGAALPVVRDFARGAGTAALLRALPELQGARARSAAGRGGGQRAGAGRAGGAGAGAGAAGPGAGGGGAGAAGRMAGRAGAQARRRGSRPRRWRWRRSGPGRGCCGVRSAGAGRLKRRCRRS